MSVESNLPIPIYHRILESAEIVVDRTCSKNEWERLRSEKMPIRGHPNTIFGKFLRKM